MPTTRSGTLKKLANADEKIIILTEKISTNAAIIKRLENANAIASANDDAKIKRLEKEKSANAVASANADAKIKRLEKQLEIAKKSSRKRNRNSYELHHTKLNRGLKSLCAKLSRGLKSPRTSSSQ